MGVSKTERETTMSKADAFAGVEETLKGKSLEHLIENLEFWTEQVKVEQKAGRVKAMKNRAVMVEKVAREIQSRA